MSAEKLPIWRTLGAALAAPFGLSAADWRSLGAPLALFAAAVALGWLAGFSPWAAFTWAPILLLALGASTWLALGFQRRILLGDAAPDPEASAWRRLALFLLGAILLTGALSVLTSGLIYAALAMAAFFLMAINSPAPLIALGAMVPSAAALVIAGYPVARLALCLPALAVDHDPRPGRIWRLSHRQGLRLTAVVVVIPGAAHGLLELMLMLLDGGFLAFVLGLAVGSLLWIVHCALLALAYRDLSDTPWPQPSPAQSPAGPHLLRLVAPFVGPLALVAGISLGGSALWDSFYVVEPGQVAVVERFGRTKRIATEPGLALKLPMVEDARVISTQETHHSTGEGRYLTISRDSLSLRYHTEWRIADAQRYARATGGSARRAEHYIDNVLTSALRDRLVKLSAAQARQLAETASSGAPAGDEPGEFPSAAAAIIGESGILGAINEHMTDLGVEAVAWQARVEASATH